MKNQELLSQISQIGQLQYGQRPPGLDRASFSRTPGSGSAGNLIWEDGQRVQTRQGDDVAGVVSSISVADSAVTLELENGKSLALDSRGGRVSRGRRSGHRSEEPVPLEHGQPSKNGRRKGSAISQRFFFKKNLLLLPRSRLVPTRATVSEVVAAAGAARRPLICRELSVARGGIRRRE